MGKHLAGLLLGAAAALGPQQAYAQFCDYIVFDHVGSTWIVCANTIDYSRRDGRGIPRSEYKRILTLDGYLKLAEERGFPSDAAGHTLGEYLEMNRKAFELLDGNGDCVLSEEDDYNKDGVIDQRDYDHFKKLGKKNGGCNPIS